MAIPIIDDKQIVEILNAQKNPFFKEYYAFYSSWFGGITTNPNMMLLPIDDHMVHRGDGVFEGMKAVKRSVYLLEEHLQRLFISAGKISLKSPFDVDQMKKIIVATLRVANKSDVMIRLYLSRGPGNFTVNPYDSIAPQFYVVISQLHEPSEKKYTQGVTVGKSAVPVKTSFLAQVKSCNYLPNVLMKKEAVDRGVDFVIGIDLQGCITESATENIMVVSQNGTILHPRLDNILKGTTMMRACELAREHGMIAEARPISLADLQAAREIMMTGTTLNVLPVVKFEGQLVADGRRGAITTKLQKFILDDINSGHHGLSF